MQQTGWLMAPILAGLLLAGTHAAAGGADRLADGADGIDWAGYGRSYGGQHYSPLDDVNVGNVATLGLAWSQDLPLGNSASEPIAVDGVLYFATGLSIIHAVDAATGRELWVHDPHAARAAGLNLRLGWGVRGLAWWDGRIFVGTQDGRLLALDARSGDEAWSVQTYPKDYPAYISGAPRVFPDGHGGGRVIIGYGGSGGVTRGYVTAYDAATGKQLWRFYTVPPAPGQAPENAAMAMAAKTWSGDWWKYGGGGDVWNAISYDPETDTVFFGVGSPYPWNQRLRGSGDNLFIDSIVAVDGGSGAYKWHYQTVPGDTWDFDATMDIALADLTIAGHPRKVLMQAPKNGFYYVIDRGNGKLISAESYVPVTWASRVDSASGRPVEMPGARYPEGTVVKLTPTPLAAHNWMPMAFSPKSGLVYIPAGLFAATFSDAAKGWKPSTQRVSDGAVNMIGGEGAATGALATHASGALIAWDPVRQRQVWSVPHPTYVNGGVLATGGGLVFQGTIDGWLNGYDAASGRVLWRFDAKAPIMGAPIAYRAGGREYVSVLTGLGMGYPGNAAAIQGAAINHYAIDPQSQARRVLTFVLGGKGALPSSSEPERAPPDPGFAPDPTRLMPGAIAFAAHCAVCHGSLAVGINYAPDLRRSAMPLSAEAFAQVVRGGALVDQGMPAFPDIPEATREDIRTYLRAQMAALRAAQSGAQRGAGHPVQPAVPAVMPGASARE